MYSFYYGKKDSTLNDSLIGGFKGQRLYSTKKMDLAYNFRNVYSEKITILGSPYEPFNRGAEHIYTKRVTKDYSNPNANFKGYYIETKDIGEIRKEEKRIL
jgi:hypothetical protein